MKKSSYILGIVSICLILIATIFKASHLPGAAILLTLGLGFLSIIFLPTAYFSLRKTTDDKLLKAVYLTAFISFFIDFIGALFKILHWPGAEKLMIIGVPLPFILFLPTYIYYHNKRKLKTDNNFFGILLFMIYLGVFSSLLALNNSKSYIYSFISTAETIEYSNTSLENIYEPSNNCKDLVERIEQLKVQLVKSTGEDTGVSIKNSEIVNYKAITKKDAKINIYTVAENEFRTFNIMFDKYAKTMINTPESERLIYEINMDRINSNANNHAPIASLPLFMTLNILNDWQNKILLMDFIQKEKL